jgi:hypothetical protein
MPNSDGNEDKRVCVKMVGKLTEKSSDGDDEGA